MLLDPAIENVEEGKSAEDEERRGNGYEFSASVSVSVSSPEGFDTLAGLPVALNNLTDSNPASLSAKCTLGVLGALCTRKCFRWLPLVLLLVEKSAATFGDDEDDLSEDLRGLPFERMMGVLGVRGRELVCGGDGGRNDSRSADGDEVGKGTAFVSPEVSMLTRGISMCEGGLTEGEKRPD